jgi:dTDP-4-amino-4,6-dideoxygalactose transaminase
MSTSQNKIQMVDLQGQYLKIKSEVDSAIQDCLTNATFINGPEVAHFANGLAKYLNAAYVIPVANGTDALQIAMMALGLKQGDEVLVPAFTYVATAEVIALLGLTPVWVDVDPATFTIDVAKLESAITDKTKAIVPVHLYGQTAAMEQLMTIAKKYQLFVIEDNAQALGADYSMSDGAVMKAGLIGDIGCTSFFPSKNLGCYGDGGALYTNNKTLAESIKMIANHGQKVKYHHDVVGVNSRLDSLQAAILNVKLNYLNDYTSARQLAASRYDSLLAGIEQIELPFRNNQSSHVFHQYTIKVRSDRDGLKHFLEQQGIPTMIYYPLPMHLQKAYLKDSYPIGMFPVSEALCSQVISLPMHTELDEATQIFIAEKIKAFFLHHVR